jgi:hypothetical protein
MRSIPATPRKRETRDAQPHDWSLADLASVAILIAGLVLLGICFGTLRSASVELGAVEKSSAPS